MSLTPVSPELAPERHSQNFNVVIVPTSSFTSGAQTFLLSAMRRDRGLRLVSPDWTEPEVRRALASAGCSPLQVEQLFRGNRMAHTGRRTDYLYFTQAQLLAVGLGPEPPRADEDTATEPAASL